MRLGRKRKTLHATPLYNIQQFYILSSNSAHALYMMGLRPNLPDVAYHFAEWWPSTALRGRLSSRL